MPMQSPLPARAGALAMELTAEQAETLADALGIAVDHYTRKAEERRKQSQTAMTISHRRRATAEAMDLTAHARRLDTLRRTLPL